MGGWVGLVGLRKMLDNMFREQISVGGVSCLKGVGRRKHLQHLFFSKACSNVDSHPHGEVRGRDGGSARRANIVLSTDMGSQVVDVGGAVNFHALL